MFKLIKNVKLNPGNMSLGKKTTIYLWIVAFLTIFVGGTSIFFSGSSLNEKVDLNKYLNYELGNISSSLHDEMGELEGYALNLSRQLSHILDNELYNGTNSISTLNDNADALTEIQKKMYAELNTTLQMSGGSGVFVILDATTNSKIDKSKTSRSGLYIKRKNFGNDVAFKQEYSFYRGIPEIAREHDIQFHTEWDLEFNIERVECFDELMNSEENSNKFFWTERIRLDGTWDDVILLCFPMYSAQNDVYGICGIELSSLFFKYKYPAVENKYGHLVVTLAPIKGNELLANKGILGDTEGTWFTNDDSLRIKKDKYYNEYRTDVDTYYGLHRSMGLSGYGDGDWSVTVLIPKEGCEEAIAKTRLKIIIIAILLIVPIVVVCILLSRKFVKPILKGFEDIKDEDGKLKPGAFGISEFDSLIEYLNQRMEDTPVSADSLPPGVEELFARFIEGVGKLTKAEYRIFRYYMDGYQVAQIPDVAYISMSTVKKHNKNIYDKLEVTSYDELMLYLDILDRCGRYDDLIRADMEEG